MLIKTISSIEKGTEVVIDGGEPTISRNLFRIARLVRQRKPSKITLCTNGLVASIPGFAEKVKESGIDNVLVSLHSHKKEVSDRLTRVPGGFDKSTRAISSFVDTGIRTDISFVINKENYKEILEFVKFIYNKFGKLHITFSFVMPAGNAWKNRWIVPKISEAVPYLRNALDYCRKNGMGFSFTGCSIPPCFLRGYEDCCGELLLKDSRWELERESGSRVRHVEDGKIKGEACKDCIYDPVCGGLFEGYVKLYGFDELKPVSKSTKYGENRNREQYQAELEFYKNVQEKVDFRNSFETIHDMFLREDIGELSEGQVRDAWKKFIQENNDGKIQYDFYLSIPFCTSMCSYCIYPSTGYDSRSMDRYVKYLMRKIDEYSEVFSGVEFRSFYAGGGTPSLLSVLQMKVLFGRLFSRFAFHKSSQKVIEFNPGTSSLEKLSTAKEIGFNKVSIGVQSLSEEVLRLNNRSVQDIDSVKNALHDMGVAGIQTKNADLVLGLKGDNKDAFIRSFRKLAAFGPDSIFIYPIMTDMEYITKNYKSLEKFNEFYFKLHESVSRDIFRIADEAGFRAQAHETLGFIHPTQFFNKNYRPPCRYKYFHHSSDQHAVFGLGYYANPIIPYSLDYKIMNKGSNKHIFLKKFPTNEAAMVNYATSYSKDFEKVKYIVNNLVHGFRLYKVDYLSRFGRNPGRDFSHAVMALKALGVLSEDEDGFWINKMDEIEMFAYLLFFVGKERVAEKI